VSAVAAFNSELLLVATVKVLALYQLQEGQLTKAAYCFTREPITSLSTAPAAAAAAADGGGGGGVTAAAAAVGSNAGLVFAADALFGVTVFRVSHFGVLGFIWRYSGWKVTSCGLFSSVVVHAPASLGVVLI
jgi:hypothetical protein